jgi:hypothetical protein
VRIRVLLFRGSQLRVSDAASGARGGGRWRLLCMSVLLDLRLKMFPVTGPFLWLGTLSGGAEARIVPRSARWLPIYECSHAARGEGIVSP